MLESELADGGLGLDPHLTSVYHRKAYFSQQRNSNIVCDVTLEVRWRDSQEPYFVWVWECKNYNHPVPVNDVEEFHAKLQQIGADNTKGTLVTTSKFEKSTIAYARANKIGLARVVRERERFSHVCALIVQGEVTQKDIATGLIAGRRAQIGSLFYALTTTGIYTDDLACLLRSEISTKELNKS